MRGSPEPIHAIGAIAGAGKSMILAYLLDMWRRGASAAGPGMAWVMVPRQSLREDIFARVKSAMPPGECRIWGSHGEREDFLDNFVREAIDGQLVEQRRELDALDADIEEATKLRNRELALRLHARRYEWLRRNYLAKQGEATTEVLARIRGVVLTVDLAIKILGGLSRKHAALVSKPIELGIVDEGHNVSEHQWQPTSAASLPPGTCSRSSGVKGPVTAARPSIG